MWTSCRWLNLPLQITTWGYAVTMRFLRDRAGCQVVLSEDGDFCSFYVTERACLKYVRSEIQGYSFADLWNMSTFIRVGKYSWIAIEVNSERHS